MVAFVGIAATAFLTLQPVFAASNIFARQSSNGTNGTGINGLSLPAVCQNNTGCAAFRTSDNSTKSLCNSTMVNNLEDCLNCVTQHTAGNSTVSNGTSLTKDEANAFIQAFIAGCAQSNITLTGFSALPTSTGAGTASTTGTSDASNLSMSAFGIVITSVLGAIALL